GVSMTYRQLLLLVMFPAVMPAGCGSWNDLTSRSVFSIVHGRTPVTFMHAVMKKSRMPIPFQVWIRLLF
ncbi:hypothetical protein LH460_12680, partial [Laribacter hongkongensis]|uniref:hypothetical protein n=1 Tax=Laribacter hongkongensis TaxID=168471 RepID=UPI001EFCFECE